MQKREKIKTETKNNVKPSFVAISDIHFSVPNLLLSSYALTAALNTAEELDVPLIIAGDLNDSKAIIRAEVANELIKILKNSAIPIYILVGNHDLINEKGEAHGLNYLAPYAKIVDKLTKLPHPKITLIPYQSDVEKLKSILETCKPGELLVMHQGVQGANMGDYVVDKTSISSDLLASFTCISGHYHGHQTVGTLTYIGSPFTMSFGEARDDTKGYLVVMTDGSYERIILNLRKHIILEFDAAIVLKQDHKSTHDPQDLIWAKVYGNKSDLERITKKLMAERLGVDNFKLDKLPYEDEKAEIKDTKVRTAAEIMDKLIDLTAESKTIKKSLKKLWRELV